MAQLMDQALSTPPRDGSTFMRPFALGMTAYLITYHILYLVTRGEFQSPDAVSDVYFFVLATYAGAPELKRWTNRQDEDPGGWHERIRKGGPLITLWFLVWAGAVIWRIKDPAIPMPPELKTITLQVMGLFFGTYALRLARKRASRSALARLEGDAGGLSAADQICDFLKRNGPATPKAIREEVDLPRRTLARLLSVLVDQGRLERLGASPQDPSATYRAREL